jgi:hypothetical protein
MFQNKLVEIIQKLYMVKDTCKNLCSSCTSEDLVINPNGECICQSYGVVNSEKYDEMPEFNIDLESINTKLNSSKSSDFIERFASKISLEAPYIKLQKIYLKNIHKLDIALTH